MIHQQIRPVPIKESYVKLEGGLDLLTPALQIPPGVCIDAGNFVPEISGGYKRVGGYERFDGRLKPSDAVYYMVTTSPQSTIVVGDTITGVSSTNTAVVIAVVSTTSLVVTKLSGALTISETLNVSATPRCTLLSYSLGGATDVLTDRQYLNLAATQYRNDIGVVPGSGPILGVWVYNGKMYAFRNNAGNTAAVMYVATTSGWQVVTTPALVAGGRYEFVNYNFSGAANALKMYGCDGKNKAFQYDGTTFTQITSTASPDTPSHIAAHKNRLFLAILGSMFLSAPGAPTGVWAAVGSTAAEIGIGDEITAMLPLPADSSSGGAMAVYSRNKTAILYGSSTATWNIVSVSPDTGALAHTAKYVSMGIALDDRGVTSLSATQNFGNFAASSISKAVQPYIDKRVGLVTDSSVLRSQNQYRVYFSDGSGLAFHLENGQMRGVLPIIYPDPVSCIVSGEDIDGAEVVFFGSSNGYVYQTEVGSSFDGVAIESWIRLAFNAERGPTTRKRWRRASLETRIPSYAKIYMAYEQDYGDYSLPVAATSLEEFAQTVETPGGGGFWDQFTWDEFTWDSPLISPPIYDLNGTSRNISLLFFSNDAYSEPFTLQSVNLHYTPRRIQR
jgi:hypothetical protein